MLNLKFSFKSVLLFLTVVKLSHLTVDSAKILVPFPSVTRSHFLGLEPILRELAKRGHEVTVINSFDQENLPDNYRHIQTPKVDLNVMSKAYLDTSENMFTIFKNAPILAELSWNENLAFLKNPQLKQIMDEEKFDLVITETFIGEPYLGLAAHFDCPSITYTSFKSTNVGNYIMRNPHALSYVSNSFVSFKEPMSFRDRVLNMMLYLFEIHVFKVYARYIGNQLYTELFPWPKYPTMHEMTQNISISLVNDHFSQGSVRPNLPTVIEIGGIQTTTETTSMPQVMADWMDSAPNGVIYFSMGTIIQIKTLSDEKLSIFLNVFQNLKQRVLWKFENDTISGLPENVMISKWLPQNSILKHPKVQVFITHGGLGSIMEAKYYGVPVIVIPVFGDQSGNADTAVDQGWGIKIHYTELTETRLNDAITEITTNSSYRDAVKHKSLLYRDRPQKPIETAIYWIEYVIRHHGAPHLRPKSFHLNWFQLHSLDVIGLLFVITLLGMYVFIRIVRCCLFKCRGRKTASLKKIQ